MTLQAFRLAPEQEWPLKMGPDHFEFEELPRSSEWMVGSEESSSSSENLGCLSRPWGPTEWGGIYIARSVCLMFREGGLTLSMRDGGQLDWNC